ncbi:MFS transporter [Bradyrhizobium sp. PRIMUS42]|uniref:MFS transporter n=1 Tax=Bradyrhizobium sp. PRIMUS42 TaxID=2908926 RepID=UPI001FF6C64C|nr:MFS transporter [Bradyrhizobium sp. PRIMUS42]MCJ9730036.1 MFS transporter [Bradyrhizobium sp. PRIMUS42]
MITAPRGLAAAQAVLGLGGLFIGTGEFAAMGLLPGMAGSVGVSIPHAGHLISAYALGVVVGSPLLAVLTAQMERRTLLMLLASIVLLGNAASALAPEFFGLAAARFLAGLPHGAYYGTASIVAAAMVPPSNRAQAIGRVMLGLAAANLLGVPIATWLGQAFGWRSAFAVVALGGLAVFGLLRVFIPTVVADEQASPRRELSAFGSLQIWLTLGVATIGFGGMFAVYSYITPTLTEVAGVAAADVPIFMALWGVGMIVGNVAGGWLADRALIRSIFGIIVWNVVFLAGFTPAVKAGPTAVGAALFLIGIGFALVPALQARLMDVARHAQSLAAAMNHSAFNLSNAIGAWMGGIAITTGYGWSSTGLVGSALAAAGLILMVIAALLTRPSAGARVSQAAERRAA